MCSNGPVVCIAAAQHYKRMLVHKGQYFRFTVWFKIGNVVHPTKVVEVCEPVSGKPLVLVFQLLRLRTCATTLQLFPLTSLEKSRAYMLHIGLPTNEMRRNDETWRLLQPGSQKL